MRNFKLSSSLTVMLDVSSGKTNQLIIMFREIIAFCSDSHTEYITGLHTVGKIRVFNGTACITWNTDHTICLQYRNDSELQGSRIATISYRSDETTGYATLDLTTHDLRNALPLDTTRSGFAPAIISPVTS
jgi:hypothetical protein